MALGLSRSLALTTTRDGRVCSHRALFGSAFQHSSLPGLSRLARIERLTLVVRDGCQILDLLHFVLLLPYLLHLSLFKVLGGALGVIGLFSQVLRGILS